MDRNAVKTVTMWWRWLMPREWSFTTLAHSSYHPRMQSSTNDFLAPSKVLYPRGPARAKMKELWRLVEMPGESAETLWSASNWACFFLNLNIYLELYVLPWPENPWHQNCFTDVFMKYIRKRDTDLTLGMIFKTPLKLLKFCMLL